MADDVKPIRRVVTGNDTQGRSCVLFDSAAPNVNPGAISRGTCMTDIWVYESAPAIISGARDDGNLPFHFEPPAAGGHLRIVQSNGKPADYDPAKDPAFKSATVDYGILLTGERTLILDRGNVVMKAGDVVVQLGNWHGWTNVNGDSLMAFVMMGAVFDKEPKV